jgi:hypothetical protein
MTDNEETKPKSRMMRYYEENKDKVKQKNTEYYYQYKDQIRSKMREKVECPYCMSIVSRGNLTPHQKTPKCKKVQEIREQKQNITT